MVAVYGAAKVATKPLLRLRRRKPVTDGGRGGFGGLHPPLEANKINLSCKFVPFCISLFFRGSRQRALSGGRTAL